MAVGLAVSKMNSEILTIEILHKNKAGEREYPGIYYTTRHIAMMGKEHIVKRTGTVLRLVPIQKLTREKPNA